MEMFCGEIYLVTNALTKKVYVGQTVEGYERRWRKHCSYAKDPEHNTYFARAIRLYGKNNFFVIPLECIYTFDNKKLHEFLDEKEKYWIQYYHSYFLDPDSNGYNMTRGGQDGAASELCEIPVIAYNLKGELFEKYRTIANAARNTGANSHRICVDCQHPELYLQSGGLIFRYADDPLDEFDIEKIREKYLEIYQYDYDGNLLNVFDNAIDAELYLHSIGIHTSTSKMILQVCNFKASQTGGFIWRKYPYDFNDGKKPKDNRIELHDIKTGELIKIYDDGIEAENDTGVPRKYITNNCRNYSCYFTKNYCFSKINKFNLSYFLIHQKGPELKLDVFTKEGIFIKRFYYMNEVKEFLNMTSEQYPNSAIRCAKGEIKTGYGYIWKYHNEQYKEAA